MGSTTERKRILIVGEAPSGRQNGGLTRSRLSDLAGAPWEEWADWINLLDEWPGRGSGKGSNWDPRAARARAATLKAEIADYDYVVLLGRRVAGSMISGGAGFPFFRWIAAYGEPTMAVIPHTSGIVRFWNDPENVAKARRFLAQIIKKEGTMATTTQKKKTSSRSSRSSSPKARSSEKTAAAATAKKSRAAKKPTTPSGYFTDRQALAAAFRAAGEPLTANEATALVIAAEVVKPPSGTTPLDYRLSAPVYREAKRGRFYKRVGDEKPAKFVLMDDVEESPEPLLTALKNEVAKKKAAETEAAPATPAS